MLKVIESELIDNQTRSRFLDKIHLFVYGSEEQSILLNWLKEGKVLALKDEEYTMHESQDEVEIKYELKMS